jgi:hypothetical protein
MDLHGEAVLRQRASVTDPYTDFVRQTLSQHPQLRAARIYRMIYERGYTGIHVSRCIPLSLSAIVISFGYFCKF